MFRLLARLWSLYRGYGYTLDLSIHFTATFAGLKIGNIVISKIIKSWFHCINWPDGEMLS